MVLLLYHDPASTQSVKDYHRCRGRLQSKGCNVNPRNITRLLKTREADAPDYPPVSNNANLDLSIKEPILTC